MRAGGAVARGISGVPVWCNKEAEASLVAGRSAAHGPCREPHPSPVSGGRRADPLSHRQMRILSVGIVGWPGTSDHVGPVGLHRPPRPCDAQDPGGGRSEHVLRGDRRHVVTADTCPSATAVPPRRCVCRDRGPARRVWPERDPPRPVGRCPATLRPLGLRRRAGAGGGADARLTRWCVARGGGAARCAGRRCGPGGATRHAASPVRAAPDRRPAGRRPRAVPVR